MIDANIPYNAGRPQPTPLARTLGQVITLRGAQQETQARQMQLDTAKSAQAADAQFSAALRSGAVYKDPKLALELLGPERGAAFVNGVVSLQKFAQGQQEANDKDIQNVLMGVLSLPDPDKPSGYTMARDILLKRGAITEQDAPPEYDPTWVQMIAKRGQQPEKPVSVSPGASLVNPTTGKPVYSAPSNPVTVAPGGSLVNPQTGQQVYQAPQAPSPALREWQDYKAQGGTLGFDAWQTMDANRKRPVTNVPPNQGPEQPPDPASSDILSQTGLSMNAFLAMTGRLTQLPRDAVTRTRATMEAQAFARKRGVDISTLMSQYKAQNAVLERNIERLNNTKIMEAELEGTIQNLQTVVGPDPTGVRAGMALKAWLGQEVNDPNAQQYKFHLGQLQNELAAYYAAAAGRPGSGITVQDNKDADETIKNGISKGGLTGLQKGVQNSTAKMGPIMQGSVDRAQKAVWTLFGVGQNYKDKGGKTETPSAGGVSYADYLKAKKK